MNQKEDFSSLDLSSQIDELQVFGSGIISTGDYERDLAISKDGHEIYYSYGNANQSRRALVYMNQVNGKWTTPSILPFSGQFNDIEPFLSPDQNQLFFASNRPLPGEEEAGDYNIWFVERKAEGWDNPIALDTLINTSTDEFYPAVTESGNLYFTATYESGIGREDIYVSEFINGSYVSPQALDTMINTGFFEFNAYVSPAEDMIVFSSFGREDGQGGGDLYLSKRDEEGNWTNAKNMGPRINSDRLDYCPFIDFERNNFYFTSNRQNIMHEKVGDFQEFQEMIQGVGNGQGDIYRIHLDAILRQ